MRNIRIYQSGSYCIHDEVHLSEMASHHLATVLRCKIGDNILIFPGDGFDYQSTITAANKKTVIVHINAKIINNTESSIKLHLGQSICKGDKMDWILQKGTELGVTEFTPIISEHSTMVFDAKRQEKKLAHWQNIIIHAAEQSGRAIIPKINAFCLLEKFMCIKNIAQNKWILSPSTIKSSEHSLANDMSSQQVILVGPEGGWSINELDIAKTAGFNLLSFGKRILRTETAPLVCISILQFITGNLS